MKKRDKISITVLTILIILFLITFLFFHLNYKMFDKKMDIIKEAKEACEGLAVNDSCEFIKKGNLTQGYCEQIKEGILICKTEKIKRRFLITPN